MFDSTLRRHLDRPLDRVSGRLEALGITPNQLTGLGWLVGVGACILVATGHWYLGLVMWLLNRVIDGLDGPLARRVGETELGGFLDIMADFSIYGGIVVAIGWHVPDARLAALVVFLAYYLNGSGFLAWSSIAEKLSRTAEVEGDGRTFHFPAGLAEGTETIAMMTLVLALGTYTAELLWVWAAIVSISVLQRFRFVWVSLADYRSSPKGRGPAT